GVGAGERIDGNGVKHEEKKHYSQCRSPSSGCPPVHCPDAASAQRDEQTDPIHGLLGKKANINSYVVPFVLAQEPVKPARINRQWLRSRARSRREDEDGKAQCGKT